MIDNPPPPPKNLWFDIFIISVVDTAIGKQQHVTVINLGLMFGGAPHFKSSDKSHLNWNVERGTEQDGAARRGDRLRHIVTARRMESLVNSATITAKSLAIPTGRVRGHPVIACPRLMLQIYLRLSHGRLCLGDMIRERHGARHSGRLEQRARERGYNGRPRVPTGLVPRSCKPNVSTAQLRTRHSLQVYLL